MLILISRIIFILITTLAMAINMSPETTVSFNNYEINRITILTEKKISYDFIQKLEYLGENKEFNEAYLLQDISNLLNSGLVQDLMVTVNVSGVDRVDIEFFLKLQPEIKYVELGNAAIPELDKIKAGLFNKVNGFVNYSVITRDINFIEKYYEEKGYILAKVTNVFFVKSLSTLIYNVSEGKISTVKFDGLTSISYGIALRQVESKPGTIFNIEKITRDKNSILKTGYFSYVGMPRVNPSLRSPGELDIVFPVQERKINNLQFGLEQLPNSKLSLAVSIRLPNFRNTGEGLYFKGQSILEPGYRDYSYYVKYNEPWFMGYPLPFNLTFWQQVNQEKTFNNNYIYVKRIGWEPAFEVNFATDWQTIIGFKQEYVSDVASQYSPYDKKSLRLITVRNSVSDYNNPLEGSKISIELEKGNNLFDLLKYGGIDFAKYNLDYSTYFNFYNKDVFAVHFGSGFFYYNNLSQQVFEPDKFSVGGAYSLRGYPETFSNKRILLNMEYRILFFDWLQGAIFFDGAIGTDGDIDGNLVKWGRGIGLRVFTPIAPLRFDFAVGDGNQFILHFALGQLF